MHYLYKVYINKYISLKVKAKHVKNKLKDNKKNVIAVTKIYIFNIYMK